MGTFGFPGDSINIRLVANRGAIPKDPSESNITQGFPVNKSARGSDDSVPSRRLNRALQNLHHHFGPNFPPEFLIPLLVYRSVLSEFIGDFAVNL